MQIDDSKIKKTSAIILSGGKSSRMGQDKCDLIYNGKTLLNLQVDKIRKIGIDDIIVSGYRGFNCNEKVLLDDIMKGPLSGIYIGLQHIKNDRALVISVDVPLIDIRSIIKITMSSHENDYDMTMIRHNGNREPLIGIYKKNLINKIEKILLSDNYSVMKLADVCNYKFIDIDDDDQNYVNINYMKDYQQLLEMKIEEEI